MFTAIIIPYPPSINGVRLTERESDIVFALADNRPHTVDEIIDIIYPRGTKALNNPCSLISSIVGVLNRKFVGCKITNDYRNRYRLEEKRRCMAMS